MSELTNQGETRSRPPGIELLVVVDAEVFARRFGEYRTKVGCDGQVAFVFEGFRDQGRKRSMDFAALDLISKYKEAGAASVIRSAGAVFANRTAEFGHGHQDNVVLMGFQVRPEGRD